MTAAPPVPNLYLIGAMKCGTTSLHRYLARHPQVFMSAVKEPELFLDPTWDEELGRPRADALAAAARGYAGEPVYGEASTSYTKAPVLREDIAARIRRAAPSARLLYVVRDPLERILSDTAGGQARSRGSTSRSS